MALSGRAPSLIAGRDQSSSRDLASMGSSPFLAVSLQILVDKQNRVCCHKRCPASRYSMSRVHGSDGGSRLRMNTRMRVVLLSVALATCAAAAAIVGRGHFT